MTIEFLSAFAFGITNYYHKSNFKNPVLIGRDTRESGKTIEKLITAVINYHGINTVSLGIIPTPGLSHSLVNEDFSIGIMITASHNPNEDNGIKLFSSNGYKLIDKEEKEIEKDINAYLSEKKNKFVIKKQGLGKHYNNNSSSKKYYSIIHKKINVPILKNKIVIDCSNGAFSKIAKKSLKNYNNIDFINNKPNGNNINLGCGALEQEKLLNNIRNNNYEFGIAFDGDGDRAIFVSKEYGIIEPEKIMVLFSMIINNNNNNNCSIVSTEICNKGLEENLNKSELNLIQTEVGDRIVVETTDINKAILGAEPSGHYYFPSHSNTMDGLIAVYYFLIIIKKYNNKLTNILADMIHYNRVTKNINIEPDSNINLKSIFCSINKIIDPNQEKFVLRQSMWDPVIRVYYDYREKNNFDTILNKINNEFIKL